MPVAVHHDNFDVYDSTYQPWNSVRIGPKRDIIAGWRKAAATAGLRFGVSSHSDRTWGWFQTSRGADTTGPKTGVRYDGWLTKADGAGKWWEGLDPADLYSPPHEGSSGPAYERFVENWRLRTEELITRYEPDLIYFDGGLPFGDVGLRVAADFYNLSRTRHGGRLDAVLNIKGGAPLEAVTHDIEKGQTDRILPFPWQTDTSLNNHWYADRLPLMLPTASSVIHLLTDVVSKNGNLLLNVALEADGILPDDQRAILRGVGDWLQVNGPAIYGTRPARIWGEGPTRVAGGSFNQRTAPFTPRDVRYTTRDGVLYAIILGVPADGRVLLRALRPGGPFTGTVRTVQLLGGTGTLTSAVTPEGLTLRLPTDVAHTPALALAITGLDNPAFDGVLRPDLDGVLDLGGYDAALEGPSLRVDEGVLAYWNDARATARWTCTGGTPGTYDVVARVAHPDGGGQAEVQVDGQSVTLNVPATGDWHRFRTVHLGTIELGTSATHTVRVVPQPGWKALNLAWIRLLPRPAGATTWCPATQGSDGRVSLAAADATLQGEQLKVEGGGGNIGFWNRAGEGARWPLRVRRAGTFRVEVDYALETAGAGSRLTLSVGDQTLAITTAATGGWGSYRTRGVGTVRLPAGDHDLRIVADHIVTGAMNLANITLVPEDAPDAALPMGAADPTPAGAVCK